MEMKNAAIKTLIALILTAGALQAEAVKHEPYAGSRIYWDISSKKNLFSSGNYARIIPLQDGRLMAVAESGGGISACYSNDKGGIWSSPELIIRSAAQLPYAVPDAIQLSNGDIVVGYNPRPSQPYSDDRLFGIRCIRSTDNGKTWSAPIFIYDATKTFEDGCWEPCFLELPSGELQCYFANENNFRTNNDQEISMCRSFDGGLTWGEATRICYSNGSRDGMPVPILTENGEIVVIVEDNGWPGYDRFRATTVRCSLEDNWTNWVDRNSPKREMIFANAADKAFVSAAPYIRRLGKDETIASWQGDRGERQGMGEERYEMSVGVGDADGRNVKAIVSPFGLSTEQHGLWNSVTALDDGTIFALSSIGDVGKGNAIYVMTGYAKKGFEAAYGTPEVNGSSQKETWTAKNARQVYLGSNATRNLATMDFLYDDKCLYFFARVIDRNIFTDKVDDDGITLGLDIENCCDTYPQQGMYRIFMDANGSVKFSAGGNNKWSEIATPEGVKFVTNLKSSYYEMEIAIPWSALGCEKAPTDRTMRCYLEVADRRDGSIVKETIPESIQRQSWTWPEFKLRSGDSGVGSILPDASGNKADVDIKCINGNVSVKSSRDIANVAVYSMSGTMFVNAKCSGSCADIPVDGLCGLYIVEILHKNGYAKRQKLVIR